MEKLEILHKASNLIKKSTRTLFLTSAGMSADWSIAPVIDWLMHKGRLLPAPEDVVREVCARVQAAGMPIERVGFFFWTLHPQYWGIAMNWDGAEVTVMRGDRSLRTSEVYTDSPAAAIVRGERGPDDLRRDRRASES